MSEITREAVEIVVGGYIYISKECRDFDIDSGNIFSVNDLDFHPVGVRFSVCVF